MPSGSHGRGVVVSGRPSQSSLPKGPALRAGVGHGTAHPSRDVGDVDEDRLAAVAGRRLGPGVRMGEDWRESSEAEFCVV